MKPAPDELVLKEETVRVTLSLTKNSIDFFKEQAAMHHTPYQKMIRSLLDNYAAHYKNKKQPAKKPKAHKAKR